MESGGETLLLSEMQKTMPMQRDSAGRYVVSGKAFQTNFCFPIPPKISVFGLRVSVRRIIRDDSCILAVAKPVAGSALFFYHTQVSHTSSYKSSLNCPQEVGAAGSLRL